MVNYVMNFAPLGVFGAIAAVVAAKGLGIFEFYIKYFGFFLIGIALLWIIILSAGFLILKGRMKAMAKLYPISHKTQPPLHVILRESGGSITDPKHRMDPPVKPWDDIKVL